MEVAGFGLKFSGGDGAPDASGVCGACERKREAGGDDAVIVLHGVLVVV